MNAFEEKVVARVECLRPDLVSLSRKIHAHPELAYEEVRASSWLSGFLASQGFDVERGVGGLPTSFVATKCGKAASPTVAFLAEYDALPKIGHGCGHNLIGPAAVGAALGAAEVIDELRGAVRVIGTPAEECTEGLGGKIRLLEAGVFENTDVCLMFHPWVETAVAEHDFGCMIHEVIFTGRSAHAAADPWNGLNALDAVVLTYNAIGALRQQIRPDSRIHCIVTRGGDALNVIPSQASARIMTRATAPDYLEALSERLKDCIQGSQQSTGTEVEIREVAHIQPSRFNARLYSVVQKNMGALGEDIRCLKLWEASSDFGNVSQTIPALSMLIKTHEPGINWHSEDVVEGGITDKAHSGMLLASKVLAMTAIDLLGDPTLLEAVRRGS